ncbi:MAG TPA: hypothetical protein VNV85_07030 [Puia sp.]|jgi:hypothetical protein|nr:hypothetical protein [Puia sp.]
MKTATNIEVRKLLLQALLSISMIVLVALAFASKGGGDKKKNVASKPDFAPINISSAFTLKNGISYVGSHIFSQQKEKASLSVNTIITYQNGNTIYIMPYKYKVSISPLNSASKTNLQLLDFKIKMHK